MNIIIQKRNGSEIEYDGSKIKTALQKANTSISDSNKQLTKSEINVIEERIHQYLINQRIIATVEDIQNLVIRNIYAMEKDELGLIYAEYRYRHEMLRKNNPMFEKMHTLLDMKNEEANQENANKEVVLLPTQRDYLAAYANKELGKRYYYSNEEIQEYHDSGKGHNHDADYTAQRMTNCGLINLSDALQHNTAINKTKIVKPNSFLIAANVTTQMIACIASCQYGGQTFNLADLVPFVNTSRKKIRQNIVRKLETTHGIIKKKTKSATCLKNPIQTMVNNRLATSHNDTEKKSWDIEMDEFYQIHSKLLEFVSISEIESMVNDDLSSEISSGMQMIQYQLITLMTTNGQTPFVSMYINIDDVSEEQKDDYAMIIKESMLQRIVGVPNKMGVFKPTAFPKVLYVINENNKPGTSFQEEDDNEKSKYWELTYLAAICSAKVMTPDYISSKLMKELKQGDVYGCMGCRSFLTIDRFSEQYGNLANAKNYQPSTHKYWGRFNQGVSTINLPHVALSSNKDITKFWEILEERLELNHMFLRKRHERLLGTPSDVAPLLWQDGIYARLKPGETIDKLLYHGYSTISLGYAGLYETVLYMTGHSHLEDGPGKELGIQIMNKLNGACEAWRDAEDIDYSVYGTPIENTTYKFAKALQKDFGIIKEITDKNYVTNSYHDIVTDKIDGFTKLRLESEYQKLSPGGAVSYIELPDMQGNIPAVMSYIQYMYDNIMYAEFNIKRDFCHECGFDGEINICQDTSTKKFYWKCPVCGNTNQNRMNIFRRMCGYPGENACNQGRMNEFAERVIHVDSKDMDYKDEL